MTEKISYGKYIIYIYIIKICDRKYNGKYIIITISWLISVRNFRYMTVCFEVNV